MTLVKIKKNFQTVVDERGEIVNILDADICHVALITSKSGAVRGNHYHPEQIQHDYLLKGKYEYIAKDIKTGATESHVIETGNLVITQPNTAHAMKFLEDSVFLTFTTGGREVEKYETHTRKFELIHLGKVESTTKTIP